MTGQRAAFIVAFALTMAAILSLCAAPAWAWPPAAAALLAIPLIQLRSTRRAHHRAAQQIADLQSQIRALEQHAAEQATAAEHARRAALNAMADHVERDLLANLAALSGRADRVKEISAAIASTAERSGQTAVVSSEAADRSVESANLLSETASDLNAAIQSISVQVEQARGIVGQALSASDDAARVMTAMTEQVVSIGSVVDLIRAIAGQTNLLALNATIEAARAGEAGKSFAVVANEVKALAQKTARATEQIVETISAIQHSNADVSGAVSQIGQSVVAIDRIANAIADAVHNQRQATANIATSVQTSLASAQDLSAQITDMTGEVGASFENAADAHMVADTIADSINALIDEMHRAVIRQLRATSPDVNRRSEERIDVELPCELDIPGHQNIPALVRDLSDGGARIELPDATTLTVGTAGSIRIADTGDTPPAVTARFIIANARTHNGMTTAGLRFEEPAIPLARRAA